MLFNWLGAAEKKTWPAQQAAPLLQSLDQGELLKTELDARMIVIDRRQNSLSSRLQPRGR